MKRVNAGSSEQHTGSRPSEQGADATDDGAIDPSAWLGLLRRFLDGSGVPRSGPSPSSIAAYDDVREQAGCTLWDATASLPYAKLLIQHRLIDVVHAVLDAALNASTSAALEEGADRSATAQHRTIEICFGILSNVCAHEQLADAHLHHRSDLQQLLLEALPCLPDPACVGELCRLLSIALRQQAYRVWLQQLSAPLLNQLLFVCLNTLDSTCLSRCLDVLVAIVHADQRLLCERNASQQGQPQISLHEELRPQPGQQQEPPGQQGPLCSDQQPGASLPPELAGPTVPGQGSSAHQAADAPRLVSCLLNMGLLDVLASVLAVACRQLQQDMPGADSRGSPAQAPQTIPSSSGHAEGHAGVGDVHSPSAGEGALATPEAAVDEDALDAALRMLEELAAAPEGRAALMQGAAAAVGDALLARGGQLPVIHSVQPVPAQAPQRDCPSAATQLPSLLLRLLMLSDSPQVVEDIVTVLLDLPALVLPLLLRDPSPLARLVDVLPELSGDAQEQVIAAAWYLTAATLQEAVQQLEPDTQQQGTGDAAVSSHGGAGPLHPGPQVAAGAEALSSGAVKQRAATAMACMGVVARLQALPMPDGCDAYLQRCLVLEEAMSG